MLSTRATSFVKHSRNFFEHQYSRGISHYISGKFSPCGESANWPSGTTEVDDETIEVVGSNPAGGMGEKSDNDH